MNFPMQLIRLSFIQVSGSSVSCWHTYPAATGSANVTTSELRCAIDGYCRCRGRTRPRFSRWNFMTYPYLVGRNSIEMYVQVLHTAGVRKAVLRCKWVSVCVGIPPMSLTPGWNDRTNHRYIHLCILIDLKF